MEAWDYRGGSLSGDGIMKGLGISVLAHVAVFFLVSLAPWVFPSRDAPLPLCTVSLLAVTEMGGGSTIGQEGSMNKGNGEPEPAGGTENIPTVPQPEAMIEPEQQEPDIVRAPEVVEDAVPLAPVHKTVEKPVEKPKPKLRPKPVPKPPRIQQTIAGVETHPPIIPKTAGESTGASDSAGGGHGEGSGMGNAEGTGKGSSGDGPGAGSGVGAGAGRGPLDTSFGSGDGPTFVARVLPKYPRIAREIGKEGTVILMVTIDERGRLVDVEVLKRAGSGFDEEAVRAVRESSFRPAKRNGKPVTCKAHLPIRFVLAGSGNN